VLKGSVATTGIGVAIRITGAIGAGSTLSSLLFGVRPYDALILTIAVAALGASGFLTPGRHVGAACRCLFRRRGRGRVLENMFQKAHD
jgi:hypothetical protein